jgi:hypothetical protein
MKTRNFRAVMALTFVCLFKSVPIMAQIWTSVPNLLARDWNAVAISADGSRVVAVNNYAIYTSTNYGFTWIPNSAPNNVIWLSVASSADGTKLVAATYGNGGGAVYTNSGTTWKICLSVGSQEISDVACSADGSTLVAATGYSPLTNVVYISRNSGGTWIAATQAPTGFSSAYCSADGTKIAATTIYPPFVSSGLIRSSDSGSTWSSNGIPMLYSITGSTDGSIMLGTGPFGVGVSTNSGTNWTFLVGANSNVPLFTNCIACSTNGMVWYGLDRTNIYSSFDGGITWSTNITPPVIPFYSPFASLAVSADGTRAVAAIEFGTIYVAMPNLKMTAAAQNISLTWPSNYLSSQFSLKESTNLAGTNWTSVPGSPIVVNTSYQVSLPTTNPQAFFRLSSP